MRYAQLNIWSWCDCSAERLGVAMLAGNYTSGRLAGVGRIHMTRDETVRQGWFVDGVADGPFKSEVKVVAE